MRARRADCIGVALQEFTETARARLFIAPDGTGRITAERLWQSLPVLSGETGKRCGQIIAQRDPLFVIILHGEDTGIRAVIVRQELAEGISIFPCAGIKRLEPPAAIDRCDAVDHLGLCMDQRLAAVRKTARLSREVLAAFRGVGVLFLLGHLLVLSGRARSA